MRTMEDSSKKLYEEKVKREIKPRNYEKYFQDVKTVHQQGGFGSIGYRYKIRAEGKSAELTSCV